jgi:hypothetical protein
MHFGLCGSVHIREAACLFIDVACCVLQTTVILFVVAIRTEFWIRVNKMCCLYEGKENRLAWLLQDSHCNHLICVCFVLSALQ